jgi:hypothetical protein
MKRLSIAIAVLSALQAGVAWAQAPSATPAAKNQQRSISLDDLKPTADMWFYEQSLRQYQDPKLAVRRNAEMRAEQRQRRLAAMQWFGLSNSRPRASSDPFHSDYSPGWVSNNYYCPYRWNGAGDSGIAARSEPNQYSR